MVAEGGEVAGDRRHAHGRVLEQLGAERVLEVRLRQRRHQPDVGGGQQAGQVVHRHAAMEVDAVAGAGARDGRLDLRTPRAVAVDVEAPDAARDGCASQASIATSSP